MSFPSQTVRYKNIPVNFRLGNQFTDRYIKISFSTNRTHTLAGGYRVSTLKRGGKVSRCINGATFWHVRSFKYSIRFPCGHEIRCQVGMEHSSMMQTSSCCYHSTKNIAIVSLLLLLVHTKGFIRTFSFTWISLFNRQWWKQFV